MNFDYKKYWQERCYAPLDMQDHWVKSILPNVVGQKVLDVGCGSGRFCPIFCSFNYTGCDINPTNIEIARKLYKGKFIVKDIVTQPIGKYDTIFIWSVLNHIPSGYLEEVRSKLEKSAKRLLIGGMKKYTYNLPYIFNVNFCELFDVKEEISIDKEFSLYVCEGKL